MRSHDSAILSQLSLLSSLRERSAIRWHSAALAQYSSDLLIASAAFGLTSSKISEPKVGSLAKLKSGRRGF